MYFLFVYHHAMLELIQVGNIIRWVVHLHGVKQKIFRAIYPRIARVQLGRIAQRSLTARETIFITLLLHHLLLSLSLYHPPYKTHACMHIYSSRDHCELKVIYSN